MLKGSAGQMDVRPTRTTMLRRCRPAAAVGLALTLGLGSVTMLPGVATAAPFAQQQQAGDGSQVIDVQWITDRRVNLSIQSVAMDTPIQVELLLARDWNSSPDANFPLLYLLDGLRARDDQSGWTLETDAESFFADKNVTVVLPVGGQSSFYTNWKEPDNGRNYQWETFLMEELPPILENQWRATNTRAIAGLSMGGTAAMTLAARHPGYFRFAGSFSGVLATSTAGMPQAISYALMDAGGYNATAMWGPPGDPAWAEHDPYELADRLQGTSLYVSSGNGAPGEFDQPSAIPGFSNNTAGSGLEILARLSSQTFVNRLNRLGIPATVSFPPDGTHSWPYWQNELHRAWPQIADSLEAGRDKPECTTEGTVADTAVANPWLGDCVTPGYQVADGTAQDFQFGRVFASADSGTQTSAGMIGGEYQRVGGPLGVLGFPITSELATPDGRGRFSNYTNGSIYFTPQTGAHAVIGEILAEWARQGYETSRLGYPVSDEIATPQRPGALQRFENAVMYFSNDTGAHRVEGRILDAFAAAGYENGALGFPLTSEVALRDGGAFNRFEGGNIYWTPQLVTAVVRNGPILDAWEAAGFENGRLGYPLGDEFPIPNGVQQNFEHGFITVVEGVTTVTP